RPFRPGPREDPGGADPAEPRRAADQRGPAVGRQRDAVAEAAGAALAGGDELPALLVPGVPGALERPRCADRLGVDALALERPDQAAVVPAADEGDVPAGRERDAV